MTLSDQLDLVRKREQAQRLDQGEAEVLAKVADQLPVPPELDNETREDLQPFVAWTTKANVRYCPAKPFVIAQYIIDTATGTSTLTLLRRLNAISALHDRHGLADPVSTTIVRSVLSDVVVVEPPRSWRKPEKEMFVTLPVEIRAAVARREREREIETRRLQNSVAELKRLNQTAADSKPVETTKEGTLTNG